MNDEKLDDGLSALTDVLECKLAMAENKAELLAEDIECLHMCLDGLGVPRASGGNVYSMWGRVQIALRSNAIAQGREHSERPTGAEG